MNILDTDIKVLGRVASIAVEGIVADAELIFDRRLTDNQLHINMKFDEEIDTLVGKTTTLNAKLSDLSNDVKSIIAQLIVFNDSISLKLDQLEFDDAPTKGSSNIVTSNGIYNWVKGLVGSALFEYDSEGNETYLSGIPHDLMMRIPDNVYLNSINESVSITAGDDVDITANDLISIISNGAGDNNKIYICAKDGGSGCNLELKSDNNINLNANSVNVNGGEFSIQLSANGEIDLNAYTSPGFYFMPKDGKHNYNGNTTTIPRGLLIVTPDTPPSNLVFLYIFTGNAIYFRMFDSVDGSTNSDLIHVNLLS